MEGVVKFDRISISNYTQDVTFVSMKRHFPSLVCRDFVANVVDFIAMYAMMSSANIRYGGV